MTVQVKFIALRREWEILYNALDMIDGFKGSSRSNDNKFIILHFEDESDVPVSMRKYIVKEKSKNAYLDVINTIMPEVDAYNGNGNQ